ncbi:MAG: NUDIX domain-containing protein [Alphaproteobacteria bacterium]|nr:NUDIX domain-containing protein [Alphaproteobacteria bacterium]
MTDSKKILSRQIDGSLIEIELDKLEKKLDAIIGIAIRDGKILILPMFGGYDFPGGGMKVGEDHLDALIREFKEETGYDVKPGEIMGAYTTSFTSHKNSKHFHQVSLVYSVEILGGSRDCATPTEDEKKYCSRAEWVNFETLKTLDFKRYVKDWEQAELWDKISALINISKTSLSSLVSSR